VSLLPTSLRQLLARRRLVSRRVVATSLHGERRGRAVGAGIEFAEYRPYEPGEDARAIDPGVYARLGTLVVRRRSTDQGLVVRILLDHTASMTGEKGVRSRELAAALAFVALRTGDSARVAVYDGGGVNWSPAATHARRAEGALRWLAERRPTGSLPLREVESALRGQLGVPGLILWVTDGWAEEGPAVVRRWAAAGQEVVVVLVLDPSEINPQLLGRGVLRLVDAETGRERDVVLDADALQRRRRAVEAWHQELRRAAAVGAGRVVLVDAGRPPTDAVRDLTVAGVLQ
jgi:uncharacterized protein (DUF58 family)